MKGHIRGTANTNVFHHHGKLMALKEDSPPVVLDPHALETLEPVYRFDGQLTAETFTAHPKLDSETGEMLGIAYEAKGLGSRDVACYSFDAQGRKMLESKDEIKKRLQGGGSPDMADALALTFAYPVSPKKIRDIYDIARRNARGSGEYDPYAVM